MTNPYDQFGDDLKSHAGRCRNRRSYVVKSEKEAPKVLRGAEKAIAEESEQLRRYRRFWKQEMQRLMDSSDGAKLQQLMMVLKTMDMMSAQELFCAIDNIDWLGTSDNTRFLVLGMIDETICRMRVRAGLPPIDDSLPGEEPTVFEICREKLKPRER